ncbi:MAG: hypothetical protein ACKOJF_01330, partial [Planctomycetaceae bacterium]
EPGPRGAPLGVRSRWAVNPVAKPPRVVDAGASIGASSPPPVDRARVVVDAVAPGLMFPNSWAGVNRRVGLFRFQGDRPAVCEANRLC